MRFKPLVSDEELQRAEADIAAQAREVAQPTVAKRYEVCEAAEAENIAQLRPEPRFDPIKAGAGVKLLAMIGLKRGLRRVETVNRIARTVALGCDAGLYDQTRKHGGREFAMAMKLHARAAHPHTPDDELLVILGWVQALVAMGCKGMTPDRARAA